MKTTLSLLLFLWIAGSSRAQLTEDFSDGNLTVNPAWSGTTTDYMINSQGVLQLNNSAADTSYVSTPHGLSDLDAKEWRFWIKQSFSPSAANFGRIYLTSGNADLTTNPDGFFLQLGEAGSLDAIRLNKSVSGLVTEICVGTSAQIASSFTVGIRIVRSNTGLWSLYVDPAGGTNYILESSATDPANLAGTHFGVLATYTASNATKFFYDNMYVGNEIVDAQAPALIGVTAVSPVQVDLLFDEAVSGLAVTLTGNYTLNPAINVSSAVIDTNNGALVHLALGNNLQNGQSYQLTVGTVADQTGNVSNGLTSNFSYLVSETPAKGDVIITEFLCDPTPVIGLAEVEFIELHNRSNKHFDLTGWKIGDASADGTITAGWILPGEYKILCSASSLTAYPNGLAVTSFPSLNNAGDDIVLKSPDTVVIDKVVYTDDWYNDAIKQDGGYTLELVNPDDPCSDRHNWTASEAISGGTPENQNSVYDPAADTQVPLLISTNAVAPDVLELVFSEGMDSSALANALLTVDPALTTAGYSVLSPFPGTMSVTFSDTITPSQVYTFTLAPVADCWLNTTSLSGTFALADTPAPGDLVINELLFDPGTVGSDFVELYNRSQKILDLQNYRIANFDDDSIANSKAITDHYLLFPGDYVVLTPDSSFQKTQFPAAVPGTFYQMALPALGNDSSTVYLLMDATVLDRVSYTAAWHLALIDETENKTLERIDPAGISSYAGNWHTAAEPIGFGTPGGQNSQYQAGGVNGDFGTLTPIFSPDNDGSEDILQFFYTMPQPGMIATLKIFDDHGRSVREILNAELLGIQGSLTWDGVNDDQQKAPVGIYLAVIVAFSTDGSVNFSKRVAFTLAGIPN